MKIHVFQLVKEAFDLFQKDRARLQGDEKSDDMQSFYNTPPNVKHGTTSYIAKAVVNTLLDGEMDVAGKCAIS